MAKLGRMAGSQLCVVSIGGRVNSQVGDSQLPRQCHALETLAWGSRGADTARGGGGQAPGTEASGSSGRRRSIGSLQMLTTENLDFEGTQSSAGSRGY